MRLRYADNIKEDPVSPWNTIRRAGLVSIGDANREKKNIIAAAEKYGEDTRKKFKNDEKELKELDSINKTLNDILGKIAPTNPDFQGFKDKDGKFDHSAMSGNERYEMIKIHRANLEDELETKKLEVDEARDEVKKATGDDKIAAQIKYDNKIKERRTIQTQIDDAKGILQRQEKIEAKLEGKKKEKEKKDSEGKEKPKEESKEKPKEEKPK